ncbi:aspartate aminotransferase [Acetitomaculum ruminis DSM 5522]|uniref:Aminotransferase n=2 Tax=Acetitomaculum ruminis TaxID=2382 RepID=A0A1I0XNU8_9FIRM|nr:aspartate aminotransferase [Acetitomaculum ruminis DSM 5522]
MGKMISDKMKRYTQGNSAIRAMFEEGKQMAKKFGKENVYDFSLGNPNVPAPKEVNEAILDIVKNENSLELHGYMSNAGYESVRSEIADFINKKHGTNFNESNIIMTVGAAGGLNVLFKTLLNPGEEVITFAPFFSEYRMYTENYDANLVVISPNTVDFQPNIKEFEEKITVKTKVVIINSPNNPTGVVYSEETLISIGKILEKKSKEFGTDIYIVSDEPYRELVYGDIEVPYVTKYYKNALVGYSFSKSLSLPGERIGYIVIPDEADDSELIKNGAIIATRILGFVNSPSLIQKVVSKCLNCKADIEFYDKNRRILYEALTSYGFECTKPDGAFYLFLKTPNNDDAEFVKTAKKYNILLVGAASFGCPGYVRIAYCVSRQTVENSLPKFKELAKEYSLC